MRRFCAALLMTSLFTGAGHALDAEQQHGRELLHRLCGHCHAVGTTGASPNRLAPAFRSFGDAKLYDDDFAQRLQDGLSTIHPEMPTFRFDRADAEAAVNYIKAIQERRKPR